MGLYFHEDVALDRIRREIDGPGSLLGYRQMFVHVVFRNCAETGADPGFSEGDLYKLPPTLSNGNYCLTSPFFARKNMVKIFALVSL